MKNFLRALRLALRYRFSLIGIFVSAVLVAAFWGGNISALYPIIEVAFQGKSLQTWADQQIEQAAAKSRELHEEIRELERSKARLSDSERLAVDARIAARRQRLKAEQAALATVRRLRPYIDRFLPSDPFQTIVAIVAVLMLATIIKDALIFANQMLVQRVVQLVAFELRRQLYHHALRMDLIEFGEHRTGALMARFNVDLGSLSTGITSVLGSALLEPLKAAACLVLAGLICWRLLVVSLLLTPLVAFLIRTLAGSIKRANRRAMEENTQLMGVLSEAFGGIQTVKAFTMENYERQRFRRTSKACMRKAMKIVFYNALTKPTIEILGMAMIFVALVAGAYLVLNHQTHILGIRMSTRPLSVAALLCFYGLLVGASDPARKMSGLLNGIQAGVAAAGRLFPVLDRQPRITDPPKPRPAPRPHRQLVFDHVWFHYTPDQPVLRDIDLTIRAGETLCVVGPNGSGKTTLVSLLPRFYDPVRGAIRLDEVDLREMRLRDLRRIVGLVTQQTLLFDDTVLNNIRYGSLSATREQVIAAAEKAHAHRFIEEKLEHGYQTVVGPGGNRLSGGERQRIALARVILRDPEILLLDEATSQIDIESEQLIHRALAEFVRDRTAIIVTHRLSTLELADRILVMQAGRIVDVGSHEELRRRCALYRGLYEIQFRQTA